MCSVGDALCHLLGRVCLRWASLGESDGAGLMGRCTWQGMVNTEDGTELPGPRRRHNRDEIGLLADMVQGASKEGPALQGTSKLARGPANYYRAPAAASSCGLTSQCQPPP